MSTPCASSTAVDLTAAFAALDIVTRDRFIATLTDVGGLSSDQATAQWEQTLQAAGVAAGSEDLPRETFARAWAPGAPVGRPQPPSKRAITLRALLEFTEQHDLWDKPTHRVVEHLIRPATAPGQGVERYHELFEPEDVGPTHIFCSHCWGSPFGLLVAGAASFIDDLVNEKGEFTEGMGAGLTFTSRRFAAVAAKEVQKALKAGRASASAERPGAELRLWIDIFAIKQHSSTDHQCLGGVVAKSPLTLMVLDNAALPLTRVWCLYEMIVTVEAFEKRPAEEVNVSEHAGAEWGGAKGSAVGKSGAAAKGGPKVTLKPNHIFHARIGSHERAHFHMAELGPMRKAVSAVDMAKAQATVASDREMILALARQVKTKAYGDGFGAINKMGKRALCNLIASKEADLL